MTTWKHVLLWWPFHNLTLKTRIAIIVLCTLLATNIGAFFGGWFSDRTIKLSQHAKIYKRTRTIIHPILRQQDIFVFGFCNITAMSAL